MQDAERAYFSLNTGITRRAALRLIVSGGSHGNPGRVRWGALGPGIWRGTHERSCRDHGAAQAAA